MSNSNHSELTLLVDGNWFLMSRLSIVNMKYDEPSKICQNLKTLMAQSINVVLRTFPDIDNIIFCADGGSWRNDLQLPSSLHHEKYGKDVEYKGTRVKSDDIDWDMIFNAFNDLIDDISRCGITVCREKGIEGDDWMWHWSRLLNRNNTNCIIWSNDKDLQQLVQMDSNGCFTICWNKKMGIISEEKDDSELEFLFNIEFSKNDTILKRLINKASSFKEIHPMDIVYDKIFKGDASDNIFPLLLRESKNGTNKKFKISKKDLDFSIDINNLAEVRNYFNNLIESKSYKNRCLENLDEVMEHFEYNKKLVWLNQISYPKTILDIMNNHVTYNKCKDISELLSKSHARSNGIEDILNTI